MVGGLLGAMIVVVKGGERTNPIREARYDFTSTIFLVGKHTLMLNTSHASTLGYRYPLHLPNFLPSIAHGRYQNL